ncbi:hypothetical protein [Nocardioides bruguierae]|uniref:Uncharacterized protein n=1 Tax=Nocardioides bruguierae TaxID=2945102 RepID=A0A9X2D3V0_9ACTN|nr:hypothetical protein [Nocardioides bruguierae]MCM0618750.1 hypothetical protein [Nocardioides bruguierae]
MKASQNTDLAQRRLLEALASLVESGPHIVDGFRSGVETGLQLADAIGAAPVSGVYRRLEDLLSAVEADRQEAQHG